MEKALNEIGKLRNEMKVGFIELESQMKSGNESIIQQMGRSNQLFVQALEKFSKKVETGFLAIEESLESEMKEIRSELASIKNRLDKANI